MKVIELLTKIANGEEVPLIKYKDKILHWNEEKVRFEDKDSMNTLYEMDFSELNDEVEIIEDEPRDIEVCGSLFTRSEYNRLAGIKKDKKIEKLENVYSLFGINKEMTKDSLVAWQSANNKIIENKINEIIDYINGGTNGE